MKSKIVLLDELIEFIMYTKSKIEYFSIPVNQIYEDYDKKSELLAEIISSKSCKKLNFDKNTANTINNFFVSLGKGFKKEEIALCDYTYDILKESSSKLKSELPNKIKIFRAISMFVSLSLIILIV